MGFFNKKKAFREVYGGAWGHLVSEHGIDVDTLSGELRCVDKDGVIDSNPVTLLRIFSMKDAEQKGVAVTGWETFDVHPDLIMFEGFLTRANKAYLKRKKP